MTFGLFAAGNCQLPRIAARLPLPAGPASLTQRLRRLLMNPAVEPATLYRPVAGSLLSCCTGGSVRLILDATDLGGRLFLTGVRLASLPEQALSLCCGWSRDNKDDEPWYILSDLPADHRALAAYAVRFHIEEMFRDFKEFGFRLETTHLKDPERVSRLLLCICLAHVWLMNADLHPFMLTGR